MLHELLMCLMGNVGGLFQYKVEHNVIKIKVCYLSPNQVLLKSTELD
jgi:hypothetical protein